MSAEFNHPALRWNRRGFLERTAAGAVASWAAALAAHAGEATEAPPRAGSLAFRPDGDAFQFNTGSLAGTLRGEGKSRGLLPVAHSASSKNLARSLGLFSHYRLLDDAHRFGTAGWDWASTAELREDGAVVVAWTRDDAHPFDMKAVYRFSAPDTLDLATQVVAREDLRRFEVFLACYFDGFPRAWTYVKPGGGAGQPHFHEAVQADGPWHMFPRDARAVDIIQDGRWKHPPNPVEWTIRPELAAPLVLRRDEDSGLCALIMARPDQCFAVAMPYGAETHRSVYLSLFGLDLRAGIAATAQTRLTIRAAPSDEAAVAAYQAFLRDTQA